ncbi:ParB/RepB/Spo0J family partition protein [Streptomyces mirabilis]|uniref:ParB/RepB/Spo0J family partition protein n=1 Tax=Streptomyces mirabilis TaxID=68239 RepID=UPI0037F57245
MKVHGSQGQVAKRLGKTPAWVSQRLALLELTPDLQEKVETGELKVEPARRIGRLPKEQQAAEAQKTINAVKPPRQRRGKPAETGNNTPTVNAVNTPEGSAEAGSDTPATVNAVNTPAGSPSPADLTAAEADRSKQGEGGQPKQLPYDDATFCVQHLHHKMTSADFIQGARVWMVILRDQHPEEYPKKGRIRRPKSQARSRGREWGCLRPTGPPGGA